MKKLIKCLSLFILLILASCQNEDTLENYNQLEETSNIDKVKEQALPIYASKTCGNSAAETSLGPGASAEQGNMCTSGNGISNQPGLLDCRAQHRGGHFFNSSDNFYMYSIEQGNKKSNVSTAVRIERTFKKITRPTSNSPFRIEFDGQLKVADLPFNDQGNSNPDYSNDYTYICQMHGSGKVFDYAPFNGLDPRPSHTTAIWLLRAQRTSATKYNLVLEYSRKPRTNNSNYTDPDRTTTTFATGLSINQVVNIEVFHGYKNRRHNGYMLINNVRYNIPTFPFTTEKMFIRYGAYRAGVKKSGANIANSKNQAKIKWRNITVCNP